MADNKWSENQPPEWTGAPIGATPAPEAWQPPTAPPVTSSPNAAAPQRRLDIGAVLRDVWTGLTSRMALFVGGSVLLVLVSIAAAVALTSVVFPDGLSADAIGILNGTYAAPESGDFEYMTDAEMQQLLTAIGEASTVVALGILPVLLIQFIFGSAITRIALNSPDQPRMSLGEAIKATPLAKIFSTGIALTVVLAVALIVMMIGMFFSLSIPAIGLLVFFGIAVAAMVWMVSFGLGVTPINAVVISENIGGFAAIRRSLAMTKGRRFAIFSAVLVVSLLASMPLNVIASGILLLNPFSFFMYFVSAMLPVALSIPATSVLTSVLYKHLR